MFIKKRERRMAPNKAARAISNFISKAEVANYVHPEVLLSLKQIQSALESSTTAD